MVRFKTQVCPWARFHPIRQPWFQCSVQTLPLLLRRPTAAHPSVRVRDYTRSSGTYVERHVRTPANDTIKDNLSYSGYGTVRVPRD